MKYRNTRRMITVAVVSLFLFGGCSSRSWTPSWSWLPWIEGKENKQAAQLAYDGMDLYKRGKYRRALEHFQQLKDWYPLSRYAILAELKSGDAHFKLEDYEEAIIAYEEFENLHPRNEAVPYVIYQIGLSHFEQIDTVDRDQSATRDALGTFQRLQQNYPQSPYAQKAEENVKKCIENLAGHDIYVGVFYYKSKHYQAALSRFEKVLKEYPDVGLHQKAKDYIQLCQAKLNNRKSP